MSIRTTSGMEAHPHHVHPGLLYVAISLIPGLLVRTVRT